MMAKAPSAENAGFAHWFTLGVGAVLILVGLPLIGGGIWLIALGGSWYYAPAGLGLIISGGLLVMGRVEGVWIYLLTYIATLLWALWEAGLNGWAQVPRLVAPTVLLILVLACIPVLRRRNPRRARNVGSIIPAGVILIALLGAGAVYLFPQGPAAVAQEPQPPEQEASPEGQTQTPREAPADSRPPANIQAQPGLSPEREAPVQDMAPLETGADWPAYGGTYHALRYSPLTEISRENVTELEQVWEYRTRDMPSEESEGDYAAETTPLKIGDNLFLCSAKNILISLHAGTGRERWRYNPGVSDDAIPYSASCRGVTYYAIPGQRVEEHCATRVIEGTIDGRLIAVDAQTGQLCQNFGVNGQINLLEGIGKSVPGFFSVTSPPTIVRGIIVVGHQVLDNQRRDAPSGVVRGYDAVTGELAWAWDMGRPGENRSPPEDETYTRGTPNMWTIATGDDELGYVYLPMGNSAVDYYGATRTAVENEYSTSLVALDVTSGEPAWHFQTVHYDVWDYDLGSQATLIDSRTQDGMVPALVLPSKQGEIYVLDRRTGEPLFPVEELPVPQGGVEPENLSPTQPFSSYHSLLMPDLEERQMWGMSPLDQLWCRIQFRRSTYDGVYTPPSVDRRWIQYPGYNGGSDWGGISIDPERGIIIANYNDMPNHNRLVPREELDELGVRPLDESIMRNADAPNDLSPQAGVPYGIDVNAGWRVGFTGLLCKEPPYGGIRAIELATGRTLWDQPLGTARKNGPFGIPSFLPFRIGTPNNGGSVLTAAGIIFIAAATDDLIRAIDVETGEVLWQDALPAGGQANPLTYEFEGRQYLVIMAGGHHFMETPIGDFVRAYALPEEVVAGGSQTN